MLRFIYRCIDFVKRRILSPVSYYRSCGVIIGTNVDIIDSEIDIPHRRLISIGNNVTITGARIIAHDASTKKALGYSKVGLVRIGNNVFIGKGAIILPGVNIGDRVIIGAGAVCSKDIPSDSVVIGNPAEIVGSYSRYIEKNRHLLFETEGTVIGSKWFYERNDSDWHSFIRQLTQSESGKGYDL